MISFSALFDFSGLGNFPPNFPSHFSDVLDLLVSMLKNTRAPAQVSFHPLQSFSNALRAVDVASVPLSVVRGWVIWELLEGQRGTGTGGLKDPRSGTRGTRGNTMEKV